MNQRIRELAEQAAKWAQQAQWSTDSRFGDRPFSDLYDEKLAELIVRECIETMYNTEQITVAQFVDDTLKQHFGVE